MAETNPNKVNQYTEPDPRQALFLKYYLDPKSKTFSNALQSGIRAGYSDEYSKTILSQELDWLSESLNQSKMLKKAERNLDNALEIDITDKEIGDRGLKATIFVASRLGKDNWSEKSEVKHTGEIQLLTEEQLKTLKEKLKRE